MFPQLRCIAALLLSSWNPTAVLIHVIRTNPLTFRHGTAGGEIVVANPARALHGPACVHEIPVVANQNPTSLHDAGIQTHVVPSAVNELPACAHIAD